MVSFSVFLGGLLVATIGAGIGLSRGVKAQARRFSDTQKMLEDSAGLKRSSDESLAEMQMLQKRAATLEIILGAK